MTTYQLTTVGSAVPFYGFGGNEDVTIWNLDANDSIIWGWDQAVSGRNVNKYNLLPPGATTTIRRKKGKDQLYAQAYSGTPTLQVMENVTQAQNGPSSNAPLVIPATTIPDLASDVNFAVPSSTTPGMELAVTVFAETGGGGIALLVVSIGPEYKVCLPIPPTERPFPTYTILCPVSSFLSDYGINVENLYGDPVTFAATANFVNTPYSGLKVSTIHGALQTTLADGSTTTSFDGLSSGSLGNWSGAGTYILPPWNGRQQWTLDTGVTATLSCWSDSTNTPIAELAAGTTILEGPPDAVMIVAAGDSTGSVTSVGDH